MMARAASPRLRPADEREGEDSLIPISMEEAVGYSSIACHSEAVTEVATVLKHNRLFLLTDRHGDIKTSGRCGLGLFHDDTRVLSDYELRVAGGPPSLLSTQVIRPYASQIDLAISDLAFGGSRWDPKHAVHIRRELVLDNTLIERLTLTNYLSTPIEYWLELSVGCDFADIFEVRGWTRERRGQFYAPQVGERDISFAYRGTDGVLLRSGLSFRERPDLIDAKLARWFLTLGPKQSQEFLWEVTLTTPSVGGAPGQHVFPSGYVDERRSTLAATYDRWTGQCSQWSSDVEIFDATLTRSIDDLRALYVEADGEDVISAGIPWYSTVFGRDSIITSLQTLPLNPRIAKDTLRYLARRQGARVNPQTEEQPGRIMHELRRGEMARSGEIPHVPYFGTIDATPLWLILLHETWRWTGDDDLVRELLPNARRALNWIEDYGDVDADGFVEYAPTSAKGLVNQGWKDSSDGVPFPDGRLPEPPIALVEVQGYVYDAKTRAAALFERFGDPTAAKRCRSEARRLRRRVIERFWMEDVGAFALALDGKKRRVPTITSNAGHLLWSRLPRPEQAARLAHILLGSDMQTGWGVRTLSARHSVFNPMSYHNGSVWPHDNGLLALGLAMNGLAAHALPILTALHDAAAHMDFNRVPELYCGMNRGNSARPVLYPVSCSPQAWASGALFMMLQAVLGIFPEAQTNVLHVRNPILPAFIHELTINRMAVGRSRVSLHFTWHGDRTIVNLVGMEGEPIQVRIELG